MEKGAISYLGKEKKKELFGQHSKEEEEEEEGEEEGQTEKDSPQKSQLIRETLVCLLRFCRSHSVQSVSRGRSKAQEGGGGGGGKEEEQGGGMDGKKRRITQL